MSKLFLRSALILCVGAWSTSAAFAQQVSLTMNNGRVTLKAQNATVRQILEEWARVGGTKVVNGEKIVGQPVTLTLVDEPESSALETILRSAAGYIVAERANPSAGASRYERIMVMARSTPVTTSASTTNAYTAAGPTPPGGGNFMAEGPVINADDDEPPQPAAPVVNPYAQGAVAATGAGAAGGNSGVPGMGTGLGSQQQQAAAAAAGAAGAPSTQPGTNANMTPGYSNVYGQAPANQTNGTQSGSFGSTTTTPGTPGSTVTVNPPETKFDYANPQKYFQQRSQQGGQNYQPYPGVPLSTTGTGTQTPSASTPPAAGTGAPGTVTPTQPGNMNPYSPNFNPYNLPAGQGVPSSNGTPPPPVEPDRAKYSNPYVQPTQPPQ